MQRRERVEGERARRRSGERREIGRKESAVRVRVLLVL